MRPVTMAARVPYVRLTECVTNPARGTEPRKPDYDGACVSNVVPTLLGAGPNAQWPQWMPTGVRDAAAVVVIVLDGLGRHQLDARLPLAPMLGSMELRTLTTVCPTTTVTALTSIVTGATPGEHGLIGYRIDFAGSVVQMLRWADDRGDARRRVPPDIVQPCPSFLGTRVPVVSKAEFEGTAFTEAHLRGVRHRGWRAASSIPVEVGALVRGGEKFVYCYYDGIDKIAHERGFGDYYDAELRAADRLVADVAAAVPAGTAIVVTSDHGQVQVGDATKFLDDAVTRNVRHQSGEGRFRWLHVRDGAVDDVVAAAREKHGDEAWVMTRDELLDGGWFGRRVQPDVRRRCGDVAVIAHADVSFNDPAEHSAFDLQCRHGALTDAEIDVPLLTVTV